jgi:DNA polymerase-1
VKNFVIIDGKSVFYRGYYAMRNLSLKDGTPTGGVYGFASILIRILQKLEPEYVAVAWDKSGTNIRSRQRIYPEYKANRHKAPDDFYAQIPLFLELLKVFRVPLYELDDFEADDIIGALAEKAVRADPDIEVDIISSDLDMLQIVGEHVNMYRLKTGFSDVEEIDVAALEQKYGILRSQFLDLKALKGDASDNIPGVPGVGDKGATKLLQEFGDLDGVYTNLDKIGGSLHKKLEEGKKLAYISKELAAIRFDAPVEFNKQELEVRFNVDEVAEELGKLEFRSLVHRVRKEKVFQSTFHATPSRSGESGICVVASEGGNAAEKVDSENLSLKTSPIPEGLFVSWDVKGEWHREGVRLEDLPKEFWDLGQGKFLLEGNSDPEENEKIEYAKQREEFAKSPRLYKIFTDFDLPLVPILYKMEMAGIKISKDKFREIEQEINAEVSETEQRIYAAAGRKFNINSPMQLSEILFDVLKLPTKGIRKKQRFFSTGIKELEKLKPLHPIIYDIEKVRELLKLKNTYVDTLPDMADAQGRIHTTFTQDVTATGRLSSINPNLQNIPVRTEAGRRIRKGFVADEGKVFVSADYAQFELRLAAVLAGDERMVEDFNSGVDIHTKTASQVYGVPMEEVTKEQRRAAKVINFGVLYGMSARGLSEGTGMFYSEAKEFIERYFEVRKPIREYLDEILRQAQTEGYVETYFGRRRLTPDVKSPNFLVRAAAERAAMNMPIQGTEADLMKRAMIRVDKILPEGARLLLQVHDSLIVECDEEIAEEVGEILKREMEGVAPELNVKLAVDVTVGKDWGEL